MLQKRMVVSPMNGQVVLFVPDSDEEPPEWPTGHELVVANSGWIFVATIPDFEGDVTIEVWAGEAPPVPGEATYDGVLHVSHAFTLVGTLTGDHLGVLPLREGPHRVQVYTMPVGASADRVLFVFD